MTVQLCGDAHLSNFEFSGRRSAGCCSTSTTSTRRFPARGSGTLKRLAASFEVHGRDRSRPGDRRAIVLALVAPDTELDEAQAVIKELLWSYRRTLGLEHHPLEEFRYVHAPAKLVGVGSVGTRCYVALMVGRDQNDPLFLQVKEAQASVLERCLGLSEYKHHGQRVVVGQKLMQAASDIFLGWVRVKDSDGTSTTTTCGSSTTGRAAPMLRGCG